MARVGPGTEEDYCQRRGEGSLPCYKKETDTYSVVRYPTASATSPYTVLRRRLSVPYVFVTWLLIVLPYKKFMGQCLCMNGARSRGVMLPAARRLKQKNVVIGNCYLLFQSGLRSNRHHAACNDQGRGLAQHGGWDHEGRRHEVRQKPGKNIYFTALENNFFHYRTDWLQGFKLKRICAGERINVEKIYILKDIICRKAPVGIFGCEIVYFFFP